MKKIVYILLIGWLNCVAITAWAATDQAAKEETTPPAAEGPLTPDQIPPIVSLPEGSNNNQPTPTTPAAAPATSDTNATNSGTPTTPPDQTSAPASSAAPAIQQQPYTTGPATGQ